MGDYAKASNLFKQLIDTQKMSAYTWEYFWSTYRSGKLDDALQILEQSNYVKLKDPQEPLAKNYWRARILDRLGKQAEATAEYAYILQQDATSYYANLSISQRPDLWEKLTNRPIQRAEIEQEPLRLASLSIDYLPKAEHRSDDVALLHDLVAAGLYRDAMNHLEKVKTSAIADSTERTSVESLAFHLADYRNYRRIALERFTEFQRFPKNLTELLNHIQTYKSQWQAVFPLAYNDILARTEELYGIDRLLILSLMRTESRYDIFAKSQVGARGLLQIMPKTALKISELIINPQFRVTELFDPSVNIATEVSILID